MHTCEFKLVKTPVVEKTANKKPVMPYAELMFYKSNFCEKLSFFFCFCLPNKKSYMNTFSVADIFHFLKWTFCGSFHKSPWWVSIPLSAEANICFMQMYGEKLL